MMIVNMIFLVPIFSFNLLMASFGRTNVVSFSQLVPDLKTLILWLGTKKHKNIALILVI